MLRRALNQRHLSRENRHLKRELRERYRFENIVGNSEAIEKVYRLIEKVSSISSNVLISGETGTGKELVARAMHYNSERADRPFVAVNCGALTDSSSKANSLAMSKEPLREPSPIMRDISGRLIKAPYSSMSSAKSRKAYRSSSCEVLKNVRLLRWEDVSRRNSMSDSSLQPIETSKMR